MFRWQSVLAWTESTLFSTALIGQDRIACNTISALLSQITKTTKLLFLILIDENDKKCYYLWQVIQSFSQDEDAQYCTVMVMVAKEQVCGIMNINKAMAIKSSCNVRGLGHSTFFHNQQDSLLSQLSFIYIGKKPCRFQMVKVHLESRLGKRVKTCHFQGLGTSHSSMVSKTHFSSIS